MINLSNKLKRAERKLQTKREELRMHTIIRWTNREEEELLALTTLMSELQKQIIVVATLKDLIRQNEGGNL